MMSLVEFLEQRITEDESHMRYMQDHAIDRVTLGERALADSYSRRVLAECQAKRRLVERYQYLHEYGDEGLLGWVCRLLALPYAEHPDFDAAWLPADEEQAR